MLFLAKSFFRENPDCRFWHIEVSGFSRFNYQPFPFGKTDRKQKKECVIKTLPKMASKFLFASLRCKLPYQLQFLTSLRNCNKKPNRKLKLSHGFLQEET